jgi:hypothetical protein
MQIVKSKRHSKYIGQFGEALVCNMLSRSGFEVMLVDHVGIDVVAYRPDVGRIGISVKSRTRDKKGKEHSSVILFRAEDAKMEEACADFNLEPWIAVYVETESGADLYLTSLNNLRNKYIKGASVATIRWKMRDRHRQDYSEDPEVKHLRLNFMEGTWFSQAQ